MHVIHLFFPSRGTGRFLAVLHIRTGDSTFTVVETNQFKHLSHLSLVFQQGNDCVIKQFLAGRLAEYKVNGNFATTFGIVISTNFGSSVRVNFHDVQFLTKHSYWWYISWDCSLSMVICMRSWGGHCILWKRHCVMSTVWVGKQFFSMLSKHGALNHGIDG